MPAEPRLSARKKQFTFSVVEVFRVIIQNKWHRISLQASVALKLAAADRGERLTLTSGQQFSFFFPSFDKGLRITTSLRKLNAALKIYVFDSSKSNQLSHSQQLILADSVYIYYFKSVIRKEGRPQFSLLFLLLADKRCSQV